MNFQELVEALKPIEVEFGTDYKNKEWNSNFQTHVTYLEFEGQKYEVKFENTEWSFSRLEKDNTFSSNPANTSVNSSKIFNRVFYVMFDGLSRFDIKSFYFLASGRNVGLKDFYDKIMKNSLFLSIMKDHGYYNVSSFPGRYSFKKL